MRVNVSIKGVEKTFSQLRRLTAIHIPEAVEKGLMSFGMLVKDAAVNDTPVDKGNLRKSAYVVCGSSKPVQRSFTGRPVSVLSKLKMQDTLAQAQSIGGIMGRSDGQIGIEVGFSAFYAIYVHTDPRMFHPRGGKAFFLADAMESWKHELPRFVSHEINGVLSKHSV